MAELTVNGRGDTEFVHPLHEYSEVKIPGLVDDIPTWEEATAEFARQQEYRERTDKAISEVYIETPADGVGLLIASGDKHIGAEGFDWARFKYETDTLLNTPLAYQLEMGDTIDNLFFSHNEEVFNVREQVSLVNAWAKSLLEKGKMLATISGNHLDWFFKYLGVEFFMLVEGYGNLVPHLRDGGDIFWKYGDVTYQIRANHKTQYNSSGLNPQHTNHRTYWMAAPNADIVLSAHTHALANETWAVRREGREEIVHFGKTGSMKAKDRFRDANGHIPRWQTGSLCYTVNPEKKEIWSVIGVDKGVRLQEMLQWELESGRQIPTAEIVKTLSEWKQE